jgi:hypothetical protein
VIVPHPPFPPWQAILVPGAIIAAAALRQCVQY